MNVLHLYGFCPKGFGKILVLEKGNSVAFVMEHEHFFTYPE
jgi:hypothetical protein